MALVTLCSAGTLSVAKAVTATTIPNAIVPLGGKGLVLNLNKYFPVPLVPTNVVIPSNSVYVNSSEGDFYIQLFPTNAPATVANFLRYVTNGLYNGTIIDRATNNFFQSGGYLDTGSLPAIASYGNVTNEAGLSNIKGTLGMLLDKTNPNSASSQWFINTQDNSTIYDKTNTAGNLPFTVFGQVVGTNGTNFMNAVAGLPIVNAYALYPNVLGSWFAQVPLQGWTNGNTTISYNNFVTINKIGIIPFVTCSDTNSFSVAIQGTNVVVTPIAPSSAPVTISINTVDTNGLLLSKSFQVSTTILRQSVNFPINETTYSTAPYSFDTFPSSSVGLGVGLSLVSGPAFVSNSNLYFKGAGIVTLTAHAAGNFFYPSSTATGYIIVDPAPQTLTSFPSIPNQTNVTVPYHLTLPSLPIASSGLPVKVVVAGHATLSGKVLSISGGGTITLTATQTGNANYYSATPLTTNFVVTSKP